MNIDRDVSKPGQASACFRCPCRVASLDNPNGICDPRKIAGKAEQTTPFHCPNGGNRTIEPNQEASVRIMLRQILGK